jgi:hypothetical protein
MPDAGLRRETDITFPDGTPWWAKMGAYALRDLWDYLTAAMAAGASALPLVSEYIDQHPDMTQFLSTPERHYLAAALGGAAFLFNIIGLIRKK